MEFYPERSAAQSKDASRHASTRPTSQEFVATATAGVDTAEKRKLVRDNSLAVFNVA